MHFIDGILNAQRYRDEILRPIVLPFIHDHHLVVSCCSVIMHGPMLQGSVHNSWKLKTSQFLHGQHTHRTCHPLSMFGMLWIGVYDSVFQQLRTAIEDEWTNIPQATINNLVNSLRRRCVALYDTFIGKFLKFCKTGLFIMKCMSKKHKTLKQMGSTRRA